MKTKLLIVSSFFTLLWTSSIQAELISKSYTQVKKPTILNVTEQTITVDGKKSKAFHIAQPDGTFGYYGKKGELFDVIVNNKTRVPLTLHWHGIVDPNNQDGIPYVTQLPIPPGKSYHYQYRLEQEGTYWLHSHYKLQEQKLMAAPLIIYDPNKPKEKDAIMFIQDFTFEDPKEIYENLRRDIQQNSNQNARVPMSLPTKLPGTEKNVPMSMSKSMTMSKPDVADVKYAAYLTNHKTLQNPEVIHVTPNEPFLLRIINASSSSNYYIDLGKLTGTLVAVDGEPIHPVTGSSFQISIGDRLDIRVQIPQGEGAYPILALPEGTKQQTGLILATAHAKIPALSETTAKDNPILDYSQEKKLSALNPLPARPVNRTLTYNLEGNMKKYSWTMNGQAWPFITPYEIKQGERVEIVFNNKTGMPHPMHFHGHVFQISEIDGQKINGRQGDTIDVMPNTTAKVIFDATNPGIWVVHCHILYHQAGGMMTTINYQGYPNRFTTKQREEGEKLYNQSPFRTSEETFPSRRVIKMTFVNNPLLMVSKLELSDGKASIAKFCYL